MNEITNIMGGAPLTMSSREIASLCGKDHRNVARDTRKTLETLHGVEGVLKFERTYVSEQNGQEYKEFLLPKRECLILVSGYSTEIRTRIIDRWMELEEKLSNPPRHMTTTETLIQMLQLQADVERKQVEQQRAIVRIEEKVERVEAAQTVMSRRPANAEAITHIRRRISRKYGLSCATIDEVMRQSPYAPKPAGMVRNEHQDADSATYAVYWQKDVSATFDRFVRECCAVSTAFFTHPFIEGRFKVAKVMEAA